MDVVIAIIASLASILFQVLNETTKHQGNSVHERFLANSTAEAKWIHHSLCHSRPHDGCDLLAVQFLITDH